MSFSVYFPCKGTKVTATATSSFFYTQGRAVCIPPFSHSRPQQKPAHIQHMWTNSLLRYSRETGDTFSVRDTSAQYFPIATQSQHLQSVNCSYTETFEGLQIFFQLHFSEGLKSGIFSMKISCKIGWKTILIAKINKVMITLNHFLWSLKTETIITGNHSYQQLSDKMSPKYQE